MNRNASSRIENQCQVNGFYLEPINSVPSTENICKSNGETLFDEDCLIVFESNSDSSLIVGQNSLKNAMWSYFGCGSRAPVLGQVTEQTPINHKIEIKQEIEPPIERHSKSRSKSKSKKCKKENVNLDLKCETTSQKRRRTIKPKVEIKEVKTKTITDYFPSQRSKRKTSVMIQKERLKEFEELILSGVEEGFEVHETLEKGRCVVTTKKIKKGDFALEYYGDLITIDEAKRRELYYASIENAGCYMYYFTFRNKQFCVDATKESHRLGRLVNHSKKGNLKTKPFLVEDTPHLILVADRDIQPGEELLYDYGDRSKRSLEYYPWLAT